MDDFHSFRAALILDWLFVSNKYFSMPRVFGGGFTYHSTLELYVLQSKPVISPALCG